MQKQIRENLALLEPGDDTHWTRAGLPDTSIVSDLVGAKVTRAQIDAAAPGFTREARDLSESSDAPPSMDARFDTSDGDTTATEPPREDTADVVVSPDDAMPSTDDTGPREAAEAQAQAAISAIRARRQELLDQIAAAKLEADECDSKIAQVRVELEAMFPPLSEAERYKQVAARSTAERRKRVESERLALEVLNRGGKSPIDRAMGARRGWGQKRPSYPQAGGAK